MPDMSQNNALLFKPTATCIGPIANTDGSIIVLIIIGSDFS